MAFTAENRWLKGKSEHKYTYTYSTISKLTGLSLNTLRKYASIGRFKPKDLGSVVKFIYPYLQQESPQKPI